jgi:hypothetical protein
MIFVIRYAQSKDMRRYTYVYASSGGEGLSRDGRGDNAQQIKTHIYPHPSPPPILADL